MRSELFPGAVVLAEVKNPREKVGCVGKIRPAVLVSRCGDDAWFLIGLTSQSTYKTTRKPRVKVWASVRNGLRSNGFLWGSNPTWVPEVDVGRVIGVVDEHLAEAIASNCDVGELGAARLRKAARQVSHAVA